MVETFREGFFFFFPFKGGTATAPGVRVLIVGEELLVVRGEIEVVEVGREEVEAIGSGVTVTATERSAEAGAGGTGPKREQQEQKHNEQRDEQQRRHRERT